MTLRELRWYATWIVRARHCLIAGEVAKAKVDNMEYAQWGARFEDAFDKLPNSLKMHHKRLITEPAERQIKREGLLAQNGRYKL